MLLKTPLHLILFALVSIVFVSCKKDINQSPIVNIIAPSNNAIFGDLGLVEIAVSASDPDGGIHLVELYIDDALVKTFVDGPYTHTYTLHMPDDYGAHEIKAIAYDGDDASSTAISTIQCIDYRAPYLGTFEFEVYRETYITNVDTTFDTLTYIGTIDVYVPQDSENDLYAADDSNFNFSQFITLRFLEDRHITLGIANDGSFLPKFDETYAHGGAFLGPDQLFFNIESGGPAEGVRYQGTGHRIE